MRAENDHDVDGIMRTFGENATFVLNGDTISGQNDIRAFYEAFGFGEAGGFTNLQVKVTRNKQAIQLAFTEHLFIQITCS